MFLPTAAIDLKIILQKHKVGIVTGSDLNYVKEQCEDLFNKCTNSVLENLIIMPCNGTKRYTWTFGGFHSEHSASVIEEWGRDRFHALIKILIGEQAFAQGIPGFNEIRIYHDFIDYRESLINWCPIGRSAGLDIRTQFIAIDEAYNIRDTLIYRLNRELSSSLPDILDKITIKKGGQTSVDIFPKGWNKTYALRHCEGDVYFVGDSCEPSGNDYELFKLLEHEGKSFKVESPDDTLRLISKFLEM